jgi:hypothetical protein
MNATNSNISICPAWHFLSVHLFSRDAVIGGMRESESRRLGEYHRSDYGN